MSARFENLRVKLFADAADITKIVDLAKLPWIRGFTTNPTLMRQAGVANYEAFARDVLHVVTDRPVSFEVFADDFEEMTWQARQIATWGPNVYVKVPVTNTLGEPAIEPIARLSDAGVKLNVTGLFTLEQTQMVSDALAPGVPSFISVFAGRIADTGRDPIPVMASAVDLLRSRPEIELIWASSRELLNIFHAEAAGCHVITVLPEILNKLNLVDKDLNEYSCETVRMFFIDARRAGYTLPRMAPAAVAVPQRT
jgi:transaldolase